MLLLSQLSPEMTNAKKKKEVVAVDTKKKDAKQKAAFNCKVCGQTYGTTTRRAALDEHIESKHSKAGAKKTFLDCFAEGDGA